MRQTPAHTIGACGEYYFRGCHNLVMENKCVPGNCILDFVVIHSLQASRNYLIQKILPNSAARVEYLRVRRSLGVVYTPD